MTNKNDYQMLITDLYNIIDKGIKNFKIQWENHQLTEAGFDYFRGLDSALADIAVDSGLSDERQKWDFEFEEKAKRRLKHFWR